MSTKHRNIKFTEFTFKHEHNNSFLFLDAKKDLVKTPLNVDFLCKQVVNLLFWCHNFCPWPHQQKIILYMWSCDQSFFFVTSISMRQVIITKILKRFDQKTFFWGWSWFKLSNLRMTLGMALKFYISVTKGWK